MRRKKDFVEINIKKNFQHFFQKKKYFENVLIYFHALVNRTLSIEIINFDIFFYQIFNEKTGISVIYFRIFSVKLN